MNPQKITGIAMIALAAVGFFLQISSDLPLPTIVSQLLVGVEFMLASLGLRAIIDEQQDTIFEAVFNWRSNTLIGGMIAWIAAPFVDPSLVPGFPDTNAVFIIGLVLQSIGLADAGKRGRSVGPNIEIRTPIRD